MIRRKSILTLALASLTTLLVINYNTAAQETEVLKTEFKEIKETGFGLRGIFTVTNVGDKDIDDVQLWIYLYGPDSEPGSSLSSSAFTDATPGLVWLKAGAATTIDIPLDRSDDHKQARELLQNNPSASKLVLKVERMTFMGE